MSGRRADASDTGDEARASDVAAKTRASEAAAKARELQDGRRDAGGVVSRLATSKATPAKTGGVMHR